MILYVYIIYIICVCDYMYACKNPCVCLNVCVTMNKYIYINTCMFLRGCNFLFVHTYSTSPYIIQFNIYNYHIMHMYILPGTPQLLSFNFLSPLRKPSTFGFRGLISCRRKSHWSWWSTQTVRNRQVISQQPTWVCLKIGYIPNEIAI